MNLIVNSKLLLLDGATGTELNRRGVDTGLPLWSANAMTTNAGLSVFRQVHLDYLNAGADVITTNTFRTNRRALAARSFSALELTLRAIATASHDGRLSACIRTQPRLRIPVPDFHRRFDE